MSNTQSKVIFAVCIVAAVSAILAIEACVQEDGALKRELAAAQTPEDEAIIFKKLLDSCGSLAFTPYGKDGAQLNISVPEWWKRLDGIDIECNGWKIHHKMIKQSNVFILMRE